MGVSTSTSTIEQLYPGVTLEWVLDHRAFIMTAHDTTRAAVDAWMERAMQVVRDWPANQPVLIAIDASDPHITRTPYQRERLKELRTLRPELKWYMALMPSRTYMMNLMQLGARLYTGRHQIRIFFERQKAIDWLASQR
jgi:hypothetical protein